MVIYKSHQVAQSCMNFLALLDSVSRAHGMGLQHVVPPASPFTNCVTVISEPIKRISFKFQF